MNLDELTSSFMKRGSLDSDHLSQTSFSFHSQIPIFNSLKDQGLFSILTSQIIDLSNQAHSNVLIYILRKKVKNQLELEFLQRFLFSLPTYSSLKYLDQCQIRSQIFNSIKHVAVTKPQSIDVLDPPAIFIAIKDECIIEQDDKSSDPPLFPLKRKCFSPGEVVFDVSKQDENSLENSLIKMTSDCELHMMLIPLETHSSILEIHAEYLRTQKLTFLRHFEFFCPLFDSQLLSLWSLMKQRILLPNQRIYEQASTESQTMFFVYEGQVQLSRIIGDRRVPCIVLKTHCYFGEEVFAKSQSSSRPPRSFEAITTTSCTLLEIHRKTLRSFLRYNNTMKIFIHDLQVKQQWKTDQIRQQNTFFKLISKEPKLNSLKCSFNLPPQQHNSLTSPSVQFPKQNQQEQAFQNHLLNSDSTLSENKSLVMIAQKYKPKIYKQVNPRNDLNQTTAIGLIRDNSQLVSRKSSLDFSQFHHVFPRHRQRTSSNSSTSSLGKLNRSQNPPSFPFLNSRNSSNEESFSRGISSDRDSEKNSSRSNNSNNNSIQKGVSTYHQRNLKGNVGLGIALDEEDDEDQRIEDDNQEELEQETVTNSDVQKQKKSTNHLLSQIFKMKNITAKENKPVFEEKNAINSRQNFGQVTRQIHFNLVNQKARQIEEEKEKRFQSSLFRSIFFTNSPDNQISYLQNTKQLPQKPMNNIDNCISSKKELRLNQQSNENSTSNTSIINIRKLSENSLIKFKSIPVSISNVQETNKSHISFSQIASNGDKSTQNLSMSLSSNSSLKKGHSIQGDFSLFLRKRDCNLKQDSLGKFQCKQSNPLQLNNRFNRMNRNSSFFEGFHSNFPPKQSNATLSFASQQSEQVDSDHMKFR